MANICSNWITVTGESEQVQALYNLVGDEFDFNKVIPTENDSSLEAREKWGCSSIAFDTECDPISRDEIEWYFWTKWCPPVPIYQKLCELFPDVFIVWRYEEPGCGLYGYLNSEEL